MISIIIPVYNEEDNISLLSTKLQASLSSIGRPYEIIIVNDCSTDRTEDKLREAAVNNPSIKIINLLRNRGQTAALMAGIHHSKGEIIIPMDGDLQNDPADISKLLAKLDEGYDVVSGWRKDRKDAAIRRNLPSRLANKLISRISGVKLHDYGCSLKAYRRSVIQHIRLYGEMHRFIPIYAKWHGAKVTEIEVTHHPRIHGKSKYGINRVFKVVLDIIVIVFLDKYFDKPIHLFGGVGLVSAGCGFLVGFLALYLKFFVGTSLISTPLPLLAVFLLFGGVISILIGLMAEIGIRTYYESQATHSYLVKNTINLEQDNKKECVV